MDSSNVWDILKGLLTLIVGVLAFMFRNLASRVDKLDDEKASKTQALDIKQLLMDHRAETRADFKEVSSTLSTILIKLGDRHD